MGSASVRPPLLGELETAVMAHLWSDGEGCAKAVHVALGKRRGITLNTIQSTLKRLFEKDLLERDKVSHAHVYRARVTREAERVNANETGALVNDGAKAAPTHSAEMQARR